MSRTRVRGPELVRQVLSAIQQDPGRDWTRQEAARLVDVSTATLERAFREAGTTFGQALAVTRMQRAEYMIRENPFLQLATVARAVGYSTEANFAVAFRRHFGVRPSDVKQFELLLKEAT